LCSERSSNLESEGTLLEASHQGGVGKTKKETKRKKAALESRKSSK